MKILKILFLVFVTPFFTVAQNKKGQMEVAIPFHPWIILTSSLYAQFEYHNNPTRSTTAVIGYQGTPFIISYFSKVKELKGVRADFGQRWYYKGAKKKYFRPFVGANLSAEYSRYTLKQDLEITQDSLQTRGLSIGPEINAGLKVVIFKRLTFAPSLGLRYYLNTHNSKSITNNPKYWQYDDWDNSNLDWKENRTTIDSYRKGFLPIPYINVGFVFKL